ncbi:MAG: hypothetical protein ACP5FH_00525 [Terracidiphilus sp.]
MPLGQAAQQAWDGSLRDASAVDWKAALRAALLLAIPAGILSSGFPLLGFFSLVWMAGVGVWAVALYFRSQRQAWITLGAGARIGLVTGLLAGWTAAATMSVLLFAMRFFFHQGQLFDSFFGTQVIAKASQQWASSGMDAQTIHAATALLNSPEGRSGLTLSAMLFLVLALVASATAGGALGARLMRNRRPTHL